MGVLQSNGDQMWEPGLPAMAVGQQQLYALLYRYRRQASSHIGLCSPKVMQPAGWVYGFKLRSMQNLAQEQLGPVILRVVEEVIGRRLFHDLALVHEDHAVGHGARKAHFVGDA